MAIKAVVFVPGEMNLPKVAMSLEEVETLNFGCDGFGASFIASELTDPTGAAVLLLDDEKVVGYTAAIGAKKAFMMSSHYYGRDSDGAAYITNSSIHPDYQHKGHVWMMLTKLEEALRAKGYHFLDRDSKADLGYADKVVARYGARVVFALPPERTMWGRQRYIRVRL